MSAALATRSRSPLGDAVLAHLQVQLNRPAPCCRRRSPRAAPCACATSRPCSPGWPTCRRRSERRGRLERERTVLLTHAAGLLGIPPHTVTLDALCTLLDGETAGLARERSARLRGTLDELQKEHAINRALMKQELAFVEHLTRLLGGGAGMHDADTYARPGGRRPRGPAPACPRPRLRALDLRA